jgi:hypothetical protein
VTASPHIPALNPSRRSTRGIALAIALSVLVHAIALFALRIEPPPVETPLPPLSARLEPLPKAAAKPAPPPRKPKPQKTKPPRPEPQPAPAAPAEAPPVIDQPVENISAAASGIDIGQPAAAGEPAGSPAQEARPAHPLPKHAQLAFIAYKGTDLAIGEMRHRLEIGDDNSYTLRTGMNTTGLASFFKTYESGQQSRGILTPGGLRPDTFSETKNSSKGKETVEAKFLWEGKTLSLSNGDSVALPEQAQDIVSFLYQLSQLPLDRDTIPMHISNGKKLERYELSVGEEEMIQTRIGWLRALPLRKIRLAGEEGLDIWLGLEYRLLPVKIRMIDRAGKIAGEMVVSEIRVADE